MNQTPSITRGSKLQSPGGRLLEVEDIFVPKNNPDKMSLVTPAFRYMSRKIVLFANGSMATLADVRAHYMSLDAVA